MKTLKLSLLIAIILSISIGSLFAGGFALSGIGSRAISMGGAFRGMANDPTAMYWNPAGLGFMEMNSISLAGAGIMPTSEFTYSGTNVGFSPEKISAEKKLWLFPNLYAVKNGESKLHYGVGVYVPYGLGAEWDLYTFPTTGSIPNPDTTDVANPYIMVPVNYPGMEKNESMSSIGVVDIHPTVSYKLMDNLSIGAGLSIQYGMIEIQKISPHPDPTQGWNVPILMDLKGTGLGFGANMGLLWKPTSNINVGLSGKLPSVVKLEGDAEFTAYPYHPVVTPDIIKSKPSATADLNLPGDIGIGIVFMPTPNWSVSMDFTETFWDCLDKVVIDIEDGATFAGNPLTDKTMNTNWENTMRISMGTEYWMCGVNAIRAGFFYDESPIPDDSINPTFPDINDKLSGNIGYTRVFGPFSFDINFEHIMFTERKIDTQTPDNLIGTYNTAVNAFNFGLTYNF